jgi:acetoin utilization protein AcuB
MFVGDKMSRSPVTVKPEASLSEALDIMKKKGIRRLPVVSDGKLVGIVTELDLLKYTPSPATSLSIWELNYIISKLRIREVMETEVVTVSPREPIEDAALLMRQHQIGGLPVVSGGKVVGMITESDIFDAFIEMLGLHRGGTRIVMKLKDEIGALHKVTGHVRDHACNLLSVVTLPAEPVPDPRSYVVMLRMEGGNIAGFIKELENAGYEIIDKGALPRGEGA